MAIVKLKYVYPDKDRQGRRRWLLRMPGRKAATLGGAYGSPEFMANYQAAIEWAEPTPKRGTGNVRPGSLRALALSYFNSGTFKGHRPETQRSQRGIISALVAKHGDKPWAPIQRKHVQAMVDEKAELPSAARNLLAVMRALGEHAIAIKWRKEGDNPALDVKRPKIKGKGFRTWTEEHCAKFEAKHPLGTRARLAYELLACTALRRSDIVRVGRQHVRKLDQPVSAGPFTVTHELDLGQQKTDEDVGGLLVLPWLQAAIDALPADNLTFIVAKNGKPLTKESFGNWFHDCSVEAGLQAAVVDATASQKD
ncbi:MAG: site-specific integrase [Methyloceanibacter sp.]